MTTISLVRHGLVDNPDQIYYGRRPGFRLAAEGREQAIAAGRRLAAQPIAVIYHSPMQRAAETAALIRDQLATPPPLIESPLLIEIDSPFDGTPVVEMERRNWELYSGVGPPYEQPADVQARILAFFDAARAAHPRQHVVAVSHGDPILFAILWGLGRPITKDQRPFLAEWGIAGGYPGCACIATFTWADGAGGQLLDFGYQTPR
jgi:broad specificity phosphatase PhoE